MQLKFWIVLAVTIVRAQGANILMLLAVPSKSHHIWVSTLVRGLSDRGHNITILSPDLDTNPPVNVHYINLEGVYEYLRNNEKIDYTTWDNKVYKTAANIYKVGTGNCKGTLKSNGLQQLLAYPNDFKFDVVLYNYAIGPCVLGFLHKFNYPPLMALTAFNNPSFTSEIVGGHNYYAYIPHCLLNYDTNMNFGQRLNNFLLHLYDYYYRTFIFMPEINAMVKPFFGSDCPKVSDLEFKSTVVLVNIDPAIGYPEPLPLNVIPVAGLQIAEPQPLAEDIEGFINSSTKGTILFSLGTNLKSNALDADKKLIFLKAFAQIPEYNFIWKLEADNLPMALPKNVMLKTWFSQNDILANKRIKAFMTHSGSLSTHEAYWYGVPMVTMPFYADQFRNSFHAVKKGVAERIDMDNLSVELVVEKLWKVLKDPSYQKNSQMQSTRFQDQPAKPLERAIWWVEYILRNPEPDHLRSPVLKLGYFVANMYDILLFFIVALSLTFFVIVKGLKALLALTKKSDKVKRQ